MPITNSDGRPSCPVAALLGLTWGLTLFGCGGDTGANTSSSAPATTSTSSTGATTDLSSDSEAPTTSGGSSTGSSGVTSETAGASSSVSSTGEIETAGTSASGTSTSGETTTGTSSTTGTPDSTGSTGSTGGPDDTTTMGTTGGVLCFDELPNPAGDMAVLAEEYVGTYIPYDLGAVPKAGGGVLARLGGLVISPEDPNIMLIVGPSEVPNAELHQIKVERGPCGHIVGFIGTATKVLSAPYLDLMSNGPKGLVFISHYPTKRLSQHIAGTMALVDSVDLAFTASHSAGGLNFVPPGYADAGMLRLMGFATDGSDAGGWYRSKITHDQDHYNIGPLTKTVDISHGPGGFAYIPAGSPLFPKQRIMVTEWLAKPQSVASYEVNDEGDPIPETRKLFFESFVRPWGSYFEPETGDYMFLQWEAMPDHIFIVQGFVPPPLLPQ